MRVKGSRMLSFRGGNEMIMAGIMKISIVTLFTVSLLGNAVDAFGWTTMSATTTNNSNSKSKKSLHMNTSPNLLPKAERLQTSFIALRHGQSIANEKHIISSNPDVSIREYGLTEAGREQALEAGKEIVSKLQYLSTADHPYNNGRSLQGVAIVSSDYKRAKETADIVAECIQQESDIQVFDGRVIVDPRIRERDFGDLHGTNDENYKKVWALDSKDPTHTEWNVESTNSVLRRTTELVCDYEEQFIDNVNGDKTKFWACVLVAHGDVLQILQTAFANINVKQHRTLLHLQTAVPRDLILTTDQDQVG